MWLMPVVHRALVCVAAGVILTFSLHGAARAAACPADPAMPALSLPHLRAAILAGSQGVIVALGSSSTVGVAASAPAHSYPAILQSDLSAALPDLHIAVLNRGISGQDAPRESERIDADAIAVRPQLIIWQVGTNAALRRMDVEGFRADVVAGVRRAHPAAAERDLGTCRRRESQRQRDDNGQCANAAARRPPANAVETRIHSLRNSLTRLDVSQRAPPIACTRL